MIGSRPARRAPWMAAALAMGMTAPLSGAQAHFKLLEPAASLEQDMRGDPQKLGPCGGTSANPGKPSGAVTPVRGGERLTVRMLETIYHPGHYRVALAVNSQSELPEDPYTLTKVTDKGPWSISAVIEKNPRPPVLADGLLQHDKKFAPGQVLEAQVKIPNINCDSCILQVIQWMADHGYNKDGGYTYHHCATLKITANPKLPLSKGWPAQVAK